MKLLLMSFVLIDTKVFVIDKFINWGKFKWLTELMLIWIMYNKQYKYVALSIFFYFEWLSWTDLLSENFRVSQKLIKLIAAFGIQWTKM
jgi:hypothetical protein